MDICLTKDHPHAYGDKLLGICICLKIAGSSPRVWGQGLVYRSRFWQIRIIPTRMGTSSNNNNKWYCGKDHPHAYGDKLYLPIVWRHSTGSSPRVWGQESAMQTENLPVRIIPTRMGTSIGAKDEFISAEDHPHAYGDKFFGDYTMATYVGSSPRVWGQVDTFNSIIIIKRIIPTRMGTSRLQRIFTVFRRDHPHAYGDKLSADIL